MNRVSINNTASSSGAYVFVINPSSVELQVSDDYSLKKVLDGGQVKQSAYFDSRPIKLSWARILDGAISNFSTMLATLHSYRGTVKYINYGDIDYRNSPTSSWQKVLVVDLEVTVDSGGLIKRSATLTITPEP